VCVRARAHIYHVGLLCHTMSAISRQYHFGTPTLTILHHTNLEASSNQTGLGPGPEAPLAGECRHLHSHTSRCLHCNAAEPEKQPPTQPRRSVLFGFTKATTWMGFKVRSLANCIAPSEIFSLPEVEQHVAIMVPPVKKCRCREEGIL
jgi:hypothetical protein